MSKTVRRSLALAVFAVAVLAVAGGHRDSVARESGGPVAERVSPNNPAVGTTAPPDAAVREGRVVAARFPEELRSIDGTGNNGAQPGWGAAGAALLRRAPAAYADGVAAPAGGHRASPRHVSNVCAAQGDLVDAAAGVTSFFWQWGQLLDHDLSLTPVADPAERFDVAVPAGDPLFDRDAAGDRAIPLERSAYRMVDGVRQQVNLVTAFIDASNVYGSDAERAAALRANDGTGRLATSPGRHLPFNETLLPNAPHPDPRFFLAGDFRANEQVALTAMHALFVREHNSWADRLREANPDADGEAIYQTARAIVGAEMQVVTYREFLPLLLGPDALPPYRGYDPGVDPGIANEFATAAYRVGHTLLPERLQRVDARGRAIPAGHLALADAFFRPGEVVAHGLEPLLRGLVAQPSQEVDARIVDGVRNFLFGPPGAGGFDLAALNLQRGRDHGLPSYNDVRRAYGLAPRATFAEIHPDPAVWEGLAAAYDDVADVEAWIGGIAEAHVAGAMVGETFRAILADQFTRLRDGDRFWYASYLPADLVALVEEQTLARIVRRNTTIGRELPPDVFRGRLRHVAALPAPPGMPAPSVPAAPER